MVSTRLRNLRIILIALLVLLGSQYELGMVVNLSDTPTTAPVPSTIPAISAALHKVGTVAVVHAAVGGVLLILALVTLVMSLLSRVRLAQVFGGLAFLSMLFAATGGLNFVLSGFQNDHSTHSMATNFLLSFALYFVELYFLKPRAV